MPVRPLIFFTIVLLAASACTPRSAPQSGEPRYSMERPPSLPALATGETPPPTPEDLELAAGKWFYGPGVGRTMANVGTVVAFPPYALYLVGNAGLSLAGFEQWYITDLLPETPRDVALQFYDGVTSVPGRLSSFVSGREYEAEQNQVPEPNTSQTSVSIQTNVRADVDTNSISSCSRDSGQSLASGCPRPHAKINLLAPRKENPIPR